MTHEVSMTTAGEIDAAWMNAGMPDDGLRIYGLRRSGNRTMTLLAVPGDSATHPAYVLSNGRYLHVSGPTLSEWYDMQDARDAADTQAGLLQF